MGPFAPPPVKRGSRSLPLSVTMLKTCHYRCKHAFPWYKGSKGADPSTVEKEAKGTKKPPEEPKVPVTCGNASDTVAGAATGGVPILTANLSANDTTNFVTGSPPNVDPLEAGTYAGDATTGTGLPTNVTTNPSTAVPASPAATKITNVSYKKFVELEVFVEFIIKARFHR